MAQVAESLGSRLNFSQNLLLISACVLNHFSLVQHSVTLSGPSVHGILQARILEWVVISFSRASFQPRDRTWVCYIAGRSFTAEPLGSPSLDLGPTRNQKLSRSLSKWVGVILK